MARFATGQSLSELEVVQNPALGAYSIWQFGLGFQSESGHPAKLPVLFLVLPLLLHQPTLTVISSTQKRSGLTLFAAKLGEDRENLLAIHSRALKLRMLTLRSIGFAVNAGLATVQYADASFRSNTPASKGKKLVLPERIRGFASSADKLGCWFARTNVSQISSTLRVNF
jgi:hypothetical protein